MALKEGCLQALRLAEHYLVRWGHILFKAQAKLTPCKGKSVRDWKLRPMISPPHVSCASETRSHLLRPIDQTLLLSSFMEAHISLEDLSSVFAVINCCGEGIETLLKRRYVKPITSSPSLRLFNLRQTMDCHDRACSFIIVCSLKVFVN